jgi:hypothetical protein
MSKFTLKSFNAELAALGVELVKGDGYFYLAQPLDAPTNQITYALASVDSTSITVVHFNQMRETQWREHIAAILADCKFSPFEIAKVGPAPQMNLTQFALAFHLEAALQYFNQTTRQMKSAAWFIKQYPAHEVVAQYDATQSRF